MRLAPIAPLGNFPQDTILSVQRDSFVGTIFVDGFYPLGSCGAHVLLWTRYRRGRQADENQLASERQSHGRALFDFQEAYHPPD